MVEMLLRRSAKPNAQNRQGMTPLILASRRGYPEVVKLLIEKKADPNMPDFTGRRPLYYARQSGRTTIEAMLRRAGGRE
jgi:ankyrin repeat protein